MGKVTDKILDIKDKCGGYITRQQLYDCGADNNIISYYLNFRHGLTFVHIPLLKKTENPDIFLITNDMEREVISP